MSLYSSGNTIKQFSNYLAQAKTEWQYGYPKVLSLIKPGGKVLDYGCGSGEFAAHLLDKATEVIGLDKSEPMLELARSKNLKGVSFYSNNKLSTWANEFDYVTANFVFCTQEDEELKSSLKEIYDMLKTDGELIILHSNWDKSNGIEFESFKLNRKENLKGGNRVIVTLKSDQNLDVTDFFRPIEEYVELLKSSSFEVKEITEPEAETLNGRGRRPAFYVISAVKQ